MVSVEGCRYDLDNESSILVSEADMFILIGATWVPALTWHIDEENDTVTGRIVHGVNEELVCAYSDQYLWDTDFKNIHPELYDEAIDRETDDAAQSPQGRL